MEGTKETEQKFYLNFLSLLDFRPWKLTYENVETE